MLDRQAQFRLAADAVTAALAGVPEVEAVALIGSVARPLWREVPRFQPFRYWDIPIWHECKDVDLAVWLDRLDRLQTLNRARSLALHQLFKEKQIGVAHHQVEIFILQGEGERLSRPALLLLAVPEGQAGMPGPRVRTGPIPAAARRL